MTNIKTRIQRAFTNDRKGGNKIGALIVEACEHLRDTGDWTPCSRALRESEAHGADHKRVKAILRHCLSGYGVKKDDTHAEKFVFVKKKGEMQGLSNGVAELHSRLLRDRTLSMTSHATITGKSPSFVFL